MGTPSDKEPSYKSPVKAAETFLDALKHKDTRVLAEATALRAQYEADHLAGIREVFKALREESLAQETLDDLARAFEEMKVVGVNRPRSTGSIGVTVGNLEDSEYRTRTLTLRHEKGGWKIMDFSHLRIQKMPNPKNSPFYRGNKQNDVEQRTAESLTGACDRRQSLLRLPVCLKRGSFYPVL